MLSWLEPKLPMSRFPQKLCAKGSQRWMQWFVNHAPHVLDEQIGLGPIDWRSPLREDDYERSSHVERRVKSGARPRQMPFFPNYVLRDVMAWYVALALLAALAAFYPWELGKTADPFAVVPARIRPEWYFLATFYTLKLIPSHVLGFEGERLGVVGFGIVALLLVLVPFLDRRASRGERSPLFTLLAVLGLVYLVTFTIIGQYAR